MKAVSASLMDKQLRPAVVDGEHVDRERRFQRGVLVEVVDDDLRDGLALEFDDDAGVLVRLVAHGGDVGDDLRVDQFRDALDEHGAVDRVGNLGDDDLLLAAAGFLDVGLAADFERTAPGRRVGADAGKPEQIAARGKIRPLDVGEDFLGGDVGVVHLRAHGVDDLAEVVRRDVGGHADGDAGAAVDEQVRERRRENGRVGGRLVVVGDEVDRVLLHVVHQRRAEVGQARLGVTHGGGRIALDAAEVALAVDEPFAHGPGLGHVDERRVDHRLAVRMVVARGVAADFGAFAVLPAGEQATGRASRRGCAAGRV